MQLSVIIPTYNRAEILKVCLERLKVQKGVEFEVIVVDDGSTDHTQSVVNDFLAEPWLRFFRQDHVQQGVARNKGVQAALADLIVFIGDDVWVGPDFLAKHYFAHLTHRDENIVVLGHTTWDPQLPINSYMRFLEASGWQFGYGFLKPGFVTRHDRFKFFYTSNISMKKAFFEKERFDETFRGYGWEDIELGYRLLQHHGMRLFYEPAIQAHHRHMILETDLPKKMQAAGRGAQFFQKIHPEADIMPKGFKWFLIRIATTSLGLKLGRCFGKTMNYKLRSWKEFLVARV